MHDFPVSRYMKNTFSHACFAYSEQVPLCEQSSVCAGQTGWLDPGVCVHIDGPWLLSVSPILYGSEHLRRNGQQSREQVCRVNNDN